MLDTFALGSIIVREADAGRRPKTLMEILAEETAMLGIAKLRSALMWTAVVLVVALMCTGCDLFKPKPKPKPLPPLANPWDGYAGLVWSSRPSELPGAGWVLKNDTGRCLYCSHVLSDLGKLTGKRVIYWFDAEKGFEGVVIIAAPSKRSAIKAWCVERYGIPKEIDGKLVWKGAASNGDSVEVTLDSIVGDVSLQIECLDI